MTATAVEQRRHDNHRITVVATQRGDYYQLERWVLCRCPHCAGHWDFVAGSDTPPHDLLLQDIAAGDAWRWSHPGARHQRQEEPDAGGNPLAVA